MWSERKMKVNIVVRWKNEKHNNDNKLKENEADVK